VIAGREPFVAHVRALTMVQSIHQGHMPEIELISETAATGIWVLEDYSIWEDGSFNHGCGHDLETYQKAAGRWRIKTMKLSCLRMDRDEAPPPAYVAGVANTAHLRRPNLAGG